MTQALWSIFGGVTTVVLTQGVPAWWRRYQKKKHPLGKGLIRINFTRDDD